MNRSEHVSSFGSDTEGLDENGDLFKDARNRHEEALFFDRVIAEKTVGANDPALAELSCDAEILPFRAARGAARVLTRAPHRRDDEITRTSPGHVGSDLHNLSQRLVTQDEFSSAGGRRAVLEGGDLAVRAADSHFYCPKQHLRACWMLR